MSHNHLVLTGQRILLDLLVDNDWKMISYLRSNEEVNTFVERPKAKTRKEAIQFIQKINEGLNQNKWYYWAIRVEGRNELVGTICLWHFSPDGKTAEIGFDLVPAYQKKGLMSEAVQLVLAFASDELSLKCIEAYTHRLNHPSIRLLEKFGFTVNKNKKDKHNANNIIFMKRLK